MWPSRFAIACPELLHNPASTLAVGNYKSLRCRTLKGRDQSKQLGSINRLSRAREPGLSWAPVALAWHHGTKPRVVCHPASPGCQLTRCANSARALSGPPALRRA
eukprot:6487750-Amphidinium_carterae.1